MPLENPYEYNETAFSEASMELSSNPSVDVLIEQLWKAGATIGDIENEFYEKIFSVVSEIEKG